MNYTIYKNRVHKYAAIHKGSCTRLKVHGGVSSTTPPTGEYCEDIETPSSRSAGGSQHRVGSQDL